MIERVLLPFGLACSWMDMAINRMLKRGGHVQTTSKDTTGRVAASRDDLRKVAAENGVVLSRYGSSLGHSLWRSQELSLFIKHKAMMTEPIVDYGCGDGSFSSLIFDKISYGVDRDSIALKTAEIRGIYEHVIESEGSMPSIGNSSVNSVFANSVFEHSGNLEDVFGEIARILRPSGAFVFTVPTISFSRHLKKYFGKFTSTDINRRFHHVNMHPYEWWASLLSKHGFDIVFVQHYQPCWMTAWYMAFNTRAFNVFKRLGVTDSDFFMRTAAKAVSKSIEISGDGANVFIAARRR